LAKDFRGQLANLHKNYSSWTACILGKMIYWQDDALKLALNEMKIILPKNHPA
jgi:hypothetical protein